MKYTWNPEVQELDRVNVECHLKREYGFKILNALLPCSDI